MVSCLLGANHQPYLGPTHVSSTRVWVYIPKLHSPSTYCPISIHVTCKKVARHGPIVGRLQLRMVAKRLVVLMDSPRKISESSMANVSPNASLTRQSQPSKTKRLHVPLVSLSLFFWKKDSQERHGCIFGAARRMDLWAHQKMEKSSQDGSRKWRLH